MDSMKGLKKNRSDGQHGEADLIVSFIVGKNAEAYLQSLKSPTKTRRSLAASCVRI